MPYIHIRIASESLPASQIQRLGTGTTRLMADILRKRPELTVVTVEALAPERWFLAGNPLPPAGACAAMAEIRITQGSNRVEEKAAFLAAFDQLLGKV
jgi:phenylpyruvate tautomerase PptA (4-oxalocrotonate tautomerase family)